jgi:hypothetical protein
VLTGGHPSRHLTRRTDHDRPYTGRNLTQETLLTELEFLATVEHALIVEYLSVCCALGYELEASEGGATSDQGLAAASAASLLAQNQMRHLKNVNRVLVNAGREPQVGRATSLSSPRVPEIPLDPPTVAQLRSLINRESSLGRAVDERYEGLRPAVSSGQNFTGDLLEAVSSVIDVGCRHVQAVADLLAPSETPRPPISCAPCGESRLTRSKRDCWT